MLFATDVLEEGIDVPECNLVVRFDRPTTFRAYVQSRGRARAKQANYVFMLPIDHPEYVGDIRDFHGTENVS
jgi:endoribonuclease Dicer